MSDTWTDPRVALPDADITIKAIVREPSGSDYFADDLAEIEMTYVGDAEWVDGCGQSYVTAEIVVWRDLTEREANVTIG
ncbi:hypothetical protein ACWPKS_15815 [Coraliomargarita sp. W4R72]